MKRMFLVISLLFVSIIVAGCGTTSTKKEVKYYDNDFVTDLGKALDARWTYTDDKTNADVVMTEEGYKTATQTELDVIEKYQDLKFKDSKLKEAALAYINELKNGLKVAKTYGSDSFYDNWEKHYNSRTSKLIAINDIKKIEVSEKNQSILDELLASGKEVQTKNKNEDTIKSFADSLTFTLDEANSDESASYYIYTATAENTTQLNFEYLSLNIKLIDDQGTTVDTQPIYENNWAANEKRNLEFTTDKTFSTIQITVNDYSLED